MFIPILLLLHHRINQIHVIRSLCPRHVFIRSIIGTYFHIRCAFVRNMSEFAVRICSNINHNNVVYLQLAIFQFQKGKTMNTTTESYPIGMRNFHAFSHFHHRFLLIFLFVFFILSSRSAMAAEPPNSVHPPSRTVSSSPALRTSRARGARRPQSDTGWY